VSAPRFYVKNKGSAVIADRQPKRWTVLC